MHALRRPSRYGAWLLVGSRLVRFASARAALACAVTLNGDTTPWASSAHCRLFTAAAANAVSLGVLIRALGGEELRRLLRVTRESFRVARWDSWRAPTC